MTTATIPLFDDVVAAWDEPLRCQTDQTEHSPNPADWLAVLHQPCGRKLICDHHLRRWALTVLAGLDRGEGPQLLEVQQTLQQPGRVRANREALTLVHVPPPGRRPNRQHRALESGLRGR